MRHPIAPAPRTKNQRSGAKGQKPQTSHNKTN